MGRGRTGVIIVDHGSRRREANEFLEALVAAFARARRDLIAEPAHLELAEPSIRTAFSSCVDRGASRVVVCPFFLLPGRHASEDIPAAVAAAARAHPGTPFAVGVPVGTHPLMLDLLSAAIADAAPGLD